MEKEKRNKLLKLKPKRSEGRLSDSGDRGNKQFIIINMTDILKQSADSDNKYVIPAAGKNFILKVIYRNRAKVQVTN